MSSTATLSDAEPNGITLMLGRQPGGGINLPVPTLVLDNAALGPDTTLDVTTAATLEADGYDTNYGTIAVGMSGFAASVRIGSAGFGQLNQEGTVTVARAATVNVDFGTVLNNDGLIELDGGTFYAPGTIGAPARSRWRRRAA